jgi:hypothetical protein
MSPFMNNIIFAGVNMLSAYRDNIPLFGCIIADVMKCLPDGIIRPIQPLKVMNFSQSMQIGKHIGNMVLSAQPDDLVPVRNEHSLQSSAYNQTNYANTVVDCSSNKKTLFIPRKCNLYDPWWTGWSWSCDSLLDGATGRAAYCIHFSAWSNKT